MECTSNGQIIRAKELDTNFTIPKKRQAENKPIEEEMKHPTTVDTLFTQTSILNDSYANGKLNPYGPPHTKLNTTSSRGIKRIHEEPKNTRPISGFRDCFGEMLDDSLPKELKEQFQPLFCILCSAKLGSSVNAKLHYASKNHFKKVRKFLAEYSERTGTPLHKWAKISLKSKQFEEYNPTHYHCDICDLPLTGKVHAESHYMGKNHQKVAAGKKAPTGKGYYNEEGKFVRLKYSAAEIATRDGIGLDFLPRDPENRPEVSEKATTLRCELCQVSVTSLPQMDMHLQGQRHLKKLRANGLNPVTTPNSDTSPQGSIYAAYRTPSGQFYCKTCNLSLNSETQFSTHLQSKNHMKKSAKSD